MTSTAEAARRAAGSELASGRAVTACLEQAVLVIGRELSYDYAPTGRRWTARLAAGRPAWAAAPGVPSVSGIPAP